MSNIPDAARQAELIKALERARYHAELLGSLRNLLVSNLATFDEAHLQLTSDLERLREATLEHQR